MLPRKSALLFIVTSLAAVTGCAPYRTSSDASPAVAANVRHDPVPAAVAQTEMKVYEGDITDRKYEKVGYITVSVKKLTLFHQDPTRQQANLSLIDKAREMGADAVINVSYKSGVGLTTWGYIDASGTAIRFIE